MYQQKVDETKNLKIMKTSELIAKLQFLMNKNGDSEIQFSVKDSFTKYGRNAEIDLRVGDTTGLPTDFNDYAYNKDGNLTTLHFHLSKSEEGKRAKIIFR